MICAEKHSLCVMTLEEEYQVRSVIYFCGWIHILDSYQIVVIPNFSRPIKDLWCVLTKYKNPSYLMFPLRLRPQNILVGMVYRPVFVLKLSCPHHNLCLHSVCTMKINTQGPTENQFVMEAHDRCVEKKCIYRLEITHQLQELC